MNNINPLIIPIETAKPKDCGLKTVKFSRKDHSNAEIEVALKGHKIIKIRHTKDEYIVLYKE
jgi:hypothetical protein